MFNRRYLVLLLIAASACGTSPSAPAPTASVAGGHGGLFTYFRLDLRTEPVSDPFGMTLTQSGSSVSGTWFSGGVSNASGTVTGTTTSTTFSGTFTWNSNAGACTGTLSVSGPAGQTTFSWTGPGVIGNCANLPTNVSFDVFNR
jgi:hypothetical protein